ncbi:MAG: hypothetical protein IJQ82_08470 [Selenomonadaceae bacterium]|nr:hypothetical protein [Selenomonadaceae bacterium]
MANPYINLYMNSPTEGDTDGTVVSSGGDFTAPISFVLDASQNENGVQKCAIRTESGFTTTGTTTISDNNDTNDRLKLCWTENGTFSDSISTNEAITNANKTFYVKASSASSESPQTDRSIKLKVNCVIASVG